MLGDTWGATPEDVSVVSSSGPSTLALTGPAAGGNSARERRREEGMGSRCCCCSCCIVGGVVGGLRPPACGGGRGRGGGGASVGIGVALLQWAGAVLRRRARQLAGREGSAGVCGPATQGGPTPQPCRQFTAGVGLQLQAVGGLRSPTPTLTFTPPWSPPEGHASRRYTVQSPPLSRPAGGEGREAQALRETPPSRLAGASWADHGIPGAPSSPASQGWLS